MISFIDLAKPLSVIIIYYVTRTKIHEKNEKKTNSEKNTKKTQTKENIPKNTKNTSRKTHHFVHI